MSTSPPIAPLSLREVAEVLVKHHGLHEGLYEVALELQVNFGAVGISPETIVPGAMIGVSKLGLRKVDALPAQPFAHLIVDAANVNPDTSAATSPAPRRKRTR